MENSSARELLGALAKMYLSYAFTGIILSNVLSYVWIDVLHISKLIAPLINSAIGVPINFLLNKFWAFDGK
jgi:putative flippase GtrA